MYDRLLRIAVLTEIKLINRSLIDLICFNQQIMRDQQQLKPQNLRENQLEDYSINTDKLKLAS